ncbi:MAG: hypothetical protein ACR2GN_05785 [Bacteroidia bacterium]
MKNGAQNSRSYREVQKFSSPLIWIFLFLLFFIFLAIIAVYLFNDYSFDKTIGNDKPVMEYIIIAVSLLIIFLLMYFFSVMKLEIVIDNKFLFFTFKPFLTRKIPLSDILGFTERKYRPLIEFRGWGIRYSLFGHGMAYTVKGNTGVQFLTRSGQKFLLGTQKPAEIIYYLNKYINSDKDNEHN